MIKLKSKLKIIWCILTGKFKHCLVINLSDNDLKNLVKEYPYGCSLDYFGLRKYIVSRVIKDLSDTKDEIDLALDKAQFEADYLINKK